MNFLAIRAGIGRCHILAARIDGRICLVGISLIF